VKPPPPVRRFRPEWLAPCGIDCVVCRAHGRARNPCPGCRAGGIAGSKARRACRIANCPRVASGRVRFCSACPGFPCVPLKRLDTRYRTRYATSVIANLEDLRACGVRRFLAREKARWACARCGATLGLHQDRCLHCNYKWR